MNYNSDEILLGFGQGFINYAEQIALNVKELRLNYFPSIGITISKIHIVDHDIEDSNGNFSLLGVNEYVIYVYGEEKVRKTCDIEGYKEIIDTLRLTIEKNQDKFTK